MEKITLFKRVLALLLLFLMVTSCQRSYPFPKAKPVISKDVYVMTSGGFAAAYNILRPQYEANSGIKLVTSYGASSGGAADSIPERLKRGERADVVILSRSALQRLVKSGFVYSESQTDLARSSIGMAVRQGEKIPDISSVEKFIKVLKEANSIGYSASASGTYLSTELFPRLGIWDEIKDKSLLVLSERVGAVVARRDVEIGFQQISEILPIGGITYVGPIPQEIQKKTIFSAGITLRGDSKTARKLIDFLVSKEAVKRIEATGLEAITEK